MRKVVLLIAAWALATPVLGQTNPCDDPVYLRLTAIDLNDMSDREFEVFSRMSEACTQFLLRNGRSLDESGQEIFSDSLGKGYSVKGFSLRPHFNTTSWYLDDNRFFDDDSHGGGAGLGFAWGFSELATLVWSFDLAAMGSDFASDYGIGHFDLGVRFTFAGTTRRFKPFANVALTGFGAERDVYFRSITTDRDDHDGRPDVISSEGGFGQTVAYVGGGITLGGGIQHFFSRKVAMDLALDLTFGEVSHVEFDGIIINRSIESFSSRFNFGIAWYPWN